VTVPIRILVDTREQRPLNFKYVEDHVKTTGEVVYKNIQTESTLLPFADYSLPGFAGRKIDGVQEVRGIAIERKNSIDEILGNLFRDRYRFTRELIGMAQYDVPVIVIENCSDGIIDCKSYRSKVLPEVVWANLWAIEEKYRVAIRLVPDRESAERCIVSTFTRYLKRLDDYKRAGVDRMARKIEAGDDETKPREIRVREWMETQARLVIAESSLVAAAGMVAALEERLKTLEAKEAGT